MAYAPNYYNYQVAVIFAIMLGGMLLLALVLGGIYFICVVNMRGKKSASIARTPSGRTDRSAARWRAVPPQQQYPPPMAVQQQQHQYSQPPYQPQSGEYTPRTPASPYTTALQQQYQIEPQMQQQQHAGPRIRDLQPEYAYQQGPTTWTSTTPVRITEEHVTYLPGSPPAGGGMTTTGYHMSSV